MEMNKRIRSGVAEGEDGTEREIFDVIVKNCFGYA
jgi:hypothetical protein